MLSKRYVLVSLGVLAVFFLLLAACAQPTPQVVEKPVEKQVPVPQTVVVEKQVPVPQTVVVEKQAPAAVKQLVIAAGFDHSSLDPGKTFEISATMIQRALYNTLVTWPDNAVDKVVPDLAEKWEVSQDGKVFTFHLRKGVKFHSGNTLTSADVKWSWERAMGLKGNPSFLFEGVDKIDTPDDYTVVVTKKDPDPAFLAKNTFFVFAPLDSKVVQQHGGVSGPDADKNDKAEEWLNQNSAGTGPFVLKKFVQKSEVDADKFPDYFRGPAFFDQVVWKAIPEPATQKLTLEAGGIDVATEVSGDQIASYQANPKVKLFQGLGTDIFFLLCNQNPTVTKGVMSNQKVCLALKYAIDYEGIKQLAGGGAITPATILPYGFAGAWGPDKAFKRDVAKAKQLLTEAGYPNGFSIDMNYPTKFARSGVDFDTVAQKVQADLAEAGIKINLKPADLQTELANYRAGTEGLGFWMWGADYYDSADYLEFLPDRLVGKRAQWMQDFADPEIKKLRDQALVEMDSAKRNQIWDQINEYLQQKGPWVPLVQPGKAIATSSALKGYQFNPEWNVDPYLLAK